MFEGKKYIYEVYKTRNFSRAAENLYIAQPSLSAIVKKIETKLGAPIFDRSTSPLQLTECGERYIRCIEKLMDMENEFDNYLNDLEGLHTGHLSIGGSNLFVSYILPPVLTEFMKKYPGVEIDLIESNTKNLERMLFTGNLDFVIDNYPFPNTVYERHLFHTEELLLAVPASLASGSLMGGSLAGGSLAGGSLAGGSLAAGSSTVGSMAVSSSAADREALLQKCRMTSEDIRNNRHLEAGAETVSLKLFADAPFLLLRAGNDTRERSDRLLTQAGIHQPKVLLSLDQQITAYHLSCYGMGIAFVADTLIKNVPADERIVFFKPEGTENRRNIYFYHKRNRYMTSAMDAFLKQI